MTPAVAPIAAPQGLARTTEAYHELRSPVSLIATLARTAQVERDEARLHTLLQSIERVAERALLSVNTILERERLDSTAADVPDVSLAGAVDDATADLRRSGRTVITDVHASAADARVPAEPGVLETLLQVLLSNAVDHSDDGEPIEVSVRARGGYATLSLENALATEPSHQGLGLGSRIARRMAQRLGAQLRTTSKDGRFRAIVRVPLAGMSTLAGDAR